MPQSLVQGSSNRGAGQEAPGQFSEVLGSCRQSVQDVLNVVALNCIQPINAKQGVDEERKTRKVVLTSQDSEAAFQQFHSEMKDQSDREGTGK